MSALVRVSKIEGRAVPIEGHDIDTDRIIPARFLKEITFSRMGRYPFYDERFNSDGSPKPHPFNDPKFQGASLLFVESNFGCGSSREHAPQALMRWGIRAIVGVSFAEIFAGNCAMLGVPTVTVSPKDARRLLEKAKQTPETVFTLDLQKKVLFSPKGEIPIDLPESRRKAFLEGTWDSTRLLLANFPKVRDRASCLPYLNFQRRA